MSWTYYDDCGRVYEFCILSDDEWKKDSLFCLFGERLIKRIAMDVGVPVDRIGFGKWGARLYPNEKDGEDKLNKWINAIENHESFKAFIIACKVATYGKSKEEELDLSYYVEEIGNIADFCFDNDIDFESSKKYFEAIIKDAKANLNKESYNLFVRMCNRDLAWFEINGKGKILEINPYKRLGEIK